MGRHNSRRLKENYRQTCARRHYIFYLIGLEEYVAMHWNVDGLTHLASDSGM